MALHESGGPPAPMARTLGQGRGVVPLSLSVSLERVTRT